MISKQVSIDLDSQMKDEHQLDIFCCSNTIKVNISKFNQNLKDECLKFKFW